MSAQPNMLSVLRNRDFFFLEANAFFSILAAEILTVALGWRIYEMSNDAFALGLVGLAQFVPTPLLVMLTGTFADRYSRRRIITICMAVEFAAMAGIAWVTQLPGAEIWPILALLVLLGAGRGQPVLIVGAGSTASWAGLADSLKLRCRSS